MKKLFFITGLMLLFTTAIAQKIAQIIIPNSGNSVTVSFLIDETIFLNLTPEGKIIDWGVTSITRRQYNNNYPPFLDKYMGREEYYAPTADSASRGKVKYIGRTALAYYAASENKDWTGRLKSVGNILIDYYPSFEDSAYRGKIKNAGTISFTYYNSHDDAGSRGKLRSVGSTSITYYSSFADKAFRGKVKTLDRQSFEYYSSFDRRDYSGMLKNGNTKLTFSGINYYVTY